MISSGHSYFVQLNRLKCGTHYSLSSFGNGKNGLQHAYFVINGLQSASMNRRFLNIMQIIVHILYSTNL